MGSFRMLIFFTQASLIRQPLADTFPQGKAILST